MYSEEEVAEIIKKAAHEGAKIALTERERREKESMKKRRDDKLRNTRILLQHYKEFKACATHSVFLDAATDRDMEAAEILDGMLNGPVDRNALSVESIRNSARRTAIIVEHIDRMMEVFEVLAYQQRSQRPELYGAMRCIRETYITEHTADLTTDGICLELNVSRSSYYRYLAQGYEVLGDLVFGIDYNLHYNCNDNP